SVLRRLPPRSTPFPYTTLFRSGFVEVAERRAGKLQLPRRLQADRAVRAGQRDDIAILLHRGPAELRHRRQQIADAARLRIGRRADRKSTRLNSSHVKISYAVFC